MGSHAAAAWFSPGQCTRNSTDAEKQGERGRRGRALPRESERGCGSGTQVSGDLLKGPGELVKDHSTVTVKSLSQLPWLELQVRKTETIPGSLTIKEDKKQDSSKGSQGWRSQLVPWATWEQKQIRRRKRFGTEVNGRCRGEKGNLEE